MTTREGELVEVRCAGIAFDADGVLVDSLQAVDDSWRAFCAEYDLDPDDVLPGVHGVRAVETIRRFLPEEEVEAAFRGLVEREVATAPRTRALPGAARLLGELGHTDGDARCVVVTSGTRRLALARLEGSGLGVPWHLVTADDVDVGKPDPAPYRRGAELLGLPPEDLVVFEDAPSGVAAANAAGCVSVALRTTHPGPLDADHRVMDLSAVELARDGAELVLRLHTG